MSTPNLEPKTLRPFIPAIPSGLLLGTAQTLVRMQLSHSNKLHLDEDDLAVLRNIPKGKGILLTANHADEMDPRVVLELSRRSGKRFLTMCNREAFDEIFGIAGWALQRLGLFSVERGAHDTAAKNYAIDVMRHSRDVLVMFPEGEIFYQNEQIHPFHSGAVEIGMQAMVDKRQHDPEWSAYIIPVAIKYHHRQPIEHALEKRVIKMESRLALPREGTLQERLRAIQKKLIQREEVMHKVCQSTGTEDLAEQIEITRNSILSQIEEKYQDLPVSPRGQTIDKSWQLAAELRDTLAKTDARNKAELIEDIKDLEEVAQLTSWNPHYWDSDASLDRLAEVVLKLERELYRIKRPRQLAARDVFVKIADPIDLGHFFHDYVSDPLSVRHKVTTNLHDQIQSLVDSLSKRTQAK